MTTLPPLPTSDPTPQRLVEEALDASTADHCVVVVDSATSANLRWANNTLTTNGVMRRSDVTVVSYDERADGVAAAAVSGTAVTLEQVLAMVAAADAAAAQAPVAPDAAPLVHGPAALDWHDAPEETDIEVYRDVAPALGEAFARDLYTRFGVVADLADQRPVLRQRRQRPDIAVGRPEHVRRAGRLDDRGRGHMLAAGTQDDIFEARARLRTGRHRGRHRMMVVRGMRVRSALPVRHP